MFKSIKLAGGFTRHICASSEVAFDAFLDKFSLREYIEDVVDVDEEAGDDLAYIIVGEGGEVVCGNSGCNNQYVDWWAKQSELAVNPGNYCYYGSIVDGDFKVVKEVYDGGLVEENIFDHKPSLKIANHSPDGFAWGYSGSGPAQFALAILLEETGNPRLALDLYQEFKSRYIASTSQHGEIDIRSGTVREFLKYHRFKSLHLACQANTDGCRIGRVWSSTVCMNEKDLDECLKEYRKPINYGDGPAPWPVQPEIFDGKSGWYHSRAMLFVYADKVLVYNTPHEDWNPEFDCRR